MNEPEYVGCLYGIHIFVNEDGFALESMGHLLSIQAAARANKTPLNAIVVDFRAWGWLLESQSRFV